MILVDSCFSSLGNLWKRGKSLGKSATLKIQDVFLSRMSPTMRYVFDKGFKNQVKLIFLSALDCGFLHILAFNSFPPFPINQLISIAVVGVTLLPLIKGLITHGILLNQFSIRQKKIAVFGSAGGIGVRLLLQATHMASHSNPFSSNISLYERMQITEYYFFYTLIVHSVLIYYNLSSDFINKKNSLEIEAVKSEINDLDWKIKLLQNLINSNDKLKSLWERDALPITSFKFEHSNITSEIFNLKRIKLTKEAYLGQMKDRLIISSTDLYREFERCVQIEIDKRNSVQRRLLIEQNSIKSAVLG